MADADVRWKQRFQSYDRAFVLLRSALEGRPLGGFNQLEREGLIQRFEYTYELDELPLPYFFDVAAMETIRNQALLDHIERVGRSSTRGDAAAPSDERRSTATSLLSKPRLGDRHSNSSRSSSA